MLGLDMSLELGDVSCIIRVEGNEGILIFFQDMTATKIYEDLTIIENIVKVRDKTYSKSKYVSNKAETNVCLSMVNSCDTNYVCIKMIGKHTKLILDNKESYKSRNYSSVR